MSLLRQLLSEDLIRGLCNYGALSHLCIDVLFLVRSLHYLVVPTLRLLFMMSDISWHVTQHVGLAFASQNGACCYDP